MILASRTHRHRCHRRFRGLGASLCAFYLLSGGTAWAQQLGHGSDDAMPVWRIVAALFVCAGVAVAAALVLKHRMQGGIALFRAGHAGPRLAVMESLRVRPQTDLCIVSCDSDQFLIVISPQGTHLLTALPGVVARSAPQTGAP